MRIRILVADDERLERKALSTILSRIEGRDFEILEAANGREALAAGASSPVDLALLDIRMPGMDGLHAAQELRSANPRIKIVFVTAFDEFDYARQALRLGVDEYLVKPASAETVTETVLRLVDRIEADREREAEAVRKSSRNDRTLDLLERELREDIGRGTVAGERLEGFLSLKGFESCKALAVTARLSASEQHKDETVRTAAFRKVTEVMDAYLGSEGWYTLSGAMASAARVIAVPPSARTGFSSGPAEVEEVLERLRDTIETKLGLRVRVGAAPAGDTGGRNLFADAESALNLASEEHPALFLLAGSSRDEWSDSERSGRTKVDLAISYLQAHLAESPSLAEVAGAVGLSPFHLSRLFSLHGGDTFVRVATKLRLDAAKALLRTGRHSVKEICALVGFKDQAYFSRVFRRAEGVSPLDWRDAR